MTGPERRFWPDGKSLIEQLAVTVNTFDEIDKQVALEAKSDQLKQEALKTSG